jgi:POT family proton-dependent oligopeptide transporter
MGIRSLIAVTGFISLAVGAMVAGSSGGKVSIGWLITFHVLNSMGFANVFPVSLALYARVAPPALSAPAASSAISSPRVTTRAKRPSDL